jgi:hypothetical protein
MLGSTGALYATIGMFVSRDSLHDGGPAASAPCSAECLGWGGNTSVHYPPPDRRAGAWSLPQLTRVGGAGALPRARRSDPGPRRVEAEPASGQKRCQARNLLGAIWGFTTAKERNPRIGRILERRKSFRISVRSGFDSQALPRRRPRG